VSQTLYTPLWCKSNYSFLEGASHPEELVETCVRLGIQSLAITDRDGVYGIARAHIKARELGLHLIVGSEVTLDDDSTLVLLAQNRSGYANLCRLISRGRLRCTKGKSVLSWEEVCEHAPDLLALWGGDRSLLVDESEHHSVAKMLKEAFADRLYALLTRHQRASEVAQEVRLKARARAYELCLVAGVEVLYHTPARRPLQDVLTCIRHGVSLHDAGTLTKPNDAHTLRTPTNFQDLYGDDPMAVDATNEIAARCTFTLDEIRYVYPSEALPDGTTSSQWLEQLAVEGARQRYQGELPVDVQAQLKKELQLIDELDYCGYFLTMFNIVEFCRSQDILCQGRGSAANSAVCYCLGITAVDPVRMGLLFERFLSRERAEPPDIDLDIEHNRREEVIQHVYTAYGREHAAMVANVIRYRPKSAVREVGKVLGLPQTALDRLAKLLSHHAEPTPELLTNAGLNPEVPTHGLLLRLVEEILDFPRHLSIHPGGFILGHDPVHTLVPIENGSMEGRTVIQWDKYDVEALGLFKVDLLGLGALHQLHLGFDLLYEHRDEVLTMATIPANDAATYEMIRAADTVGVFQIESRAQMSMLPRLKPANFYDLVVEVSIVRPGPITGGMVHPYLRRRNGEEPVTYPHECLEPVLSKTLGVPLFQEQVMKLAMVAADYTPGEADQLRRDMAAWRRSGRIERHRARLVARMCAKGIAHEFAERVFEQIRGFGEYGFPESHAASFALISYATSYMKCHYPAEFCCSLLNAQPMGFYSASTLVNDAKRHGVEIRPVDVRESQWNCTLEPIAEGFAIRMGLRFIKGLGSRQLEILEEAWRAGPFTSIEDFARRTDFDERVMAVVAEAGAFEGFGDDRRQALWKVQHLGRTEPISLPFGEVEAPIEFPPLDPLESVTWDYRSSQHSTRGHLLEPLRKFLQVMGLPAAATLNARPDKTRVRYAGLVICRQRPGTAKGVTFMTLEDETGFVNLVIWQKTFDRYSVLARTEAFLGVSGKLQNQDNVTHLVVDHMWKPRLPLPSTLTRSRDFH